MKPHFCFTIKEFSFLRTSQASPTQVAPLIRADVLIPRSSVQFLRERRFRHKDWLMSLLKPGKGHTHITFLTHEITQQLRQHVVNGTEWWSGGIFSPWGQRSASLWLYKTTFFLLGLALKFFGKKEISLIFLSLECQANCLVEAQIDQSKFDTQEFSSCTVRACTCKPAFDSLI